MKPIIAILSGATHIALPALATEHRVTIKEAAFHPSFIEAALGDTVIFVNADTVPHTASAIAGGLDTARQDGGAFDTGLIGPNGSAVITITRPGVVDFACKNHPSVRGRIDTNWISTRQYPGGFRFLTKANPSRVLLGARSAIYRTDPSITPFQFKPFGDTHDTF